MHPRHNYDQTTNKHGTQLLQLCHSLGLYIVNGGVRGDSYGQFTYSSCLGDSTVDYFITDLSLVSLRAFTVSPLTPLSDHSKTTLYLYRSTRNLEVSQQTKLHPIKTCYKQKENTAEIYQNAIRQQQVQVLLNNFLEKAFQHNGEGVNKGVENLNKIDDLSASLSNLKASNRKAKNNKNMTNGRLTMNVKILEKTLSQKYRDPDNQNTHLHYITKH